MHSSFEAHPGGVESVAFSTDGKTMASAGWDHHVKLWVRDGGDRFQPKLLWNFAGFSDWRSLAGVQPRRRPFWPLEDSIGS